MAHVLPKLTSAIPSVETKATAWPHLSRLRLADPSFNTPRPIDVILGADVYCQIIENGLIKGPENTPMAQSTKLGWIISGPSGLAATTPAQGYHVSVDNDLHDLLQRFGCSKSSPCDQGHRCPPRIRIVKTSSSLLTAEIRTAGTQSGCHLNSQLSRLDNLEATH